jgi:large subunit ribosomal protein L13
MRTHSAKPQEVDRKWYVVDATDQALGRLASGIAAALRGKRSPRYTPWADCGDYVIVVNAGKIKLSGDKLDKKFAYRHSGYPGGFRGEVYRHLLERRPAFAIEKAVKGMLPNTPLGRKMRKKLKVYATATHPHAAQKPEALAL